MLPRNADLTPAFENAGNPFKIFKNLNTYNEHIETLSTMESSRRCNTEQNKNNLFITNDISDSMLPIIDSPKEFNMFKSQMKKPDLFSKPILDKIDQIVNYSSILLFSNFKIVQNQTYLDFKERNQENWYIIHLN